MASGRALILGLGNSVLGDDGAGIHAARAARQMLGPADPITVREAEVGGFALLDCLEGFQAAVLIDAEQRPGGAVGQIRAFEVDAAGPAIHVAAGHQLDLPTVLALGKTLGYVLPPRVAVLTVQADDVTSFSEHCTAQVAAVIPQLASRAIALARAELASGRPRN